MEINEHTQGGINEHTQGGINEDAAFDVKNWIYYVESKQNLYINISDIKTIKQSINNPNLYYFTLYEYNIEKAFIINITNFDYWIYIRNINNIHIDEIFHNYEEQLSMSMSMPTLVPKFISCASSV